MRIHSIKVQNYRLHGDVAVELDPLRTLIGGPNECGKSTLIEAAHRALFLKAKVTGEIREGMMSDTHQGHPQVEVRFEAGGKAYEIAKRFSGPSGTATLSEEGGDSWHGDDAESRLAEVLKVGGAIGGRGAADRIAAQWAHLWVWQGRAGYDPSADVSGERDSLLARLKTEGGAAAMQSALDSEVASHFSSLEKDLFTSRGKPKTGSELARAGDEVESAQVELTRAEEAVARLQEAVASFQNADRTIRGKNRDVEEFRSQLNETETRLAEVAERRREEDRRKTTAEQDAKEHEALVKADREIRDLLADIRKQEKALEPKNAETDRLEESGKTRKKQFDDADKIFREIDRELRAARSRSDLSKALVKRFECEEDLAVLQRSAEEIAGLKAEVAQVEADLARLPEIDQAGVDALQGLARTAAESKAALEAMAAGIEIVASDVEVKVGGAALQPGEVRIIDGDTEVEVGEAATLKITPGGGTSLAEAGERLRESSRQLQEELGRIGLTAIDEAAGVVARRQEFGRKIETTTAELAGKGADAIEERLAKAATDVEAAGAEIERRRAVVDEFTEPKDPESAQSLVVEAERVLNDLEGRESLAGAERDAASRAHEEAVEALARHRQSVADDEAALTQAKAKLVALEEMHGEASARKQELERLFAARKESEDQLAETREALKKLQPEALDADKARLTRALSKADEARQAAEQARAVSRNILASDGALDPEESLALARARLESAAGRHASVERRAGAIRLLSEMFSEKQQALAHQFTQPLAEKISDYLQQLFGRDARARVSLADGNFEGLRLTRPEGTYEFGSLSGGTREQVAAAVRLAMAEILAEDHDGCLPVVFDDAFTNCDPERVQTLQRMLDLAARRDLQVIVLTCTPSDYAGLGAQTVTIAPPPVESADSEPDGT